MNIAPFIRLARPHHWVKNVIVFFPIAFARRIDEPRLWLSICLSAAAFCFVSSAAYITNDIKDRKGEMRDGIFIKEGDL